MSASSFSVPFPTFQLCVSLALVPCAKLLGYKGHFKNDANILDIIYGTAKLKMFAELFCVRMSSRLVVGVRRGGRSAEEGGRCDCVLMPMDLLKHGRDDDVKLKVSVWVCRHFVWFMAIQSRRTIRRRIHYKWCNIMISCELSVYSFCHRFSALVCLVALVSVRVICMWKHIEAVPGFQCPSIALDSHESRTTANNGTGLVSIHPRKKRV